MLRASELDTMLQMRSQESWVQRQNQIPQHSGHPALDTAQGIVVSVSCEHILLGHVTLQQLIFPSLSPQGCSQSILCLACTCGWISLNNVQDLALGLDKLHEVHMVSLVEPVKVPLDGISSLLYVSHTIQLGVMDKCAKKCTESHCLCCWQRCQTMPVSNNTDPWGSPSSLVSTWTSSSWFQCFERQFLIHWVVCPICAMGTGMLSRKVPNALHKFR